MDGEAVQEIRELAELAHVGTIEVAGKEYATRPVHDPRKPDPEPEAIELHTLTGLADYLEHNLDELKADDCQIHVVGPQEVRIVTRVRGDFNQRFVYARAVANDLTSGLFGAFRPVEEMVIAIQSRFDDGADRDKVLQLIGNVRDETEVGTEDDGVSQRVNVRAGVHLAEEVKVPNPVDLLPFRTFREIEPPRVSFILRVKKSSAGPTVALFEADGGAWAGETIQAIGLWLREHNDEFPIVS